MTLGDRSDTKPHPTTRDEIQAAVLLRQLGEQTRARAKLEYSALATAFCPTQFTVGELRAVYEAVWSAKLDPRNFHRKVTGTPGFLIPTGRTTTRAADDRRGSTPGQRHAAEPADPAWLTQLALAQLDHRRLDAALARSNRNSASAVENCIRKCGRRRVKRTRTEPEGADRLQLQRRSAPAAPRHTRRPPLIHFDVGAHVAVAGQHRATAYT